MARRSGYEPLADALFMRSMRLQSCVNRWPAQCRPPSPKVSVLASPYQNILVTYPDERYESGGVTNSFPPTIVRCKLVAGLKMVHRASTWELATNTMP